MDEVSQVRGKIDIVSLISEYIPLKKTGRNFKAVCPFHSEKTPSFIVSPERQIWHCFGCGKGGDCFTFLMEYESVEFIEALRILARKVGIELKQYAFSTSQASEKEKIYRLNQIACDFYHYALTKHPVGKPALLYLTKKRKIDPRLINTFMLGFSPRNGSALSTFLLKKKSYKRQDLIEAGLAFEREGRTVDFFRNRIMFPLYDARNNIVGFSGRILDETQVPIQSGSKYINTKDTAVYHKGSMFFGLNLAKDEIKKNEQAIIMEGEFDVISSYASGIKNVVAIKGTALTDSQANLIARFAPKVTLCLDKDEAGFEAIKRSLPVLEKRGFITTIVNLKDYKDPDEAIKKDALFFKKAIKNDIGIYDFLTDYFLKTEDKKTALGKKKITDNLLPFLNLIDNGIVKEHYLKNLSFELDTSYENLVFEMEKLGKEEKAAGKSFISQKKDQRDRREILEEYLLSLILQSEHVKESFEIASQTLSEYSFEIPSYQKIYEGLSSYFKKHEKFDNKLFTAFLPKETMPVLDVCFLLPLPKFPDEDKFQEEIKKEATELRVLYIKNKIKDTTMSLKIKSKDKDEEEIESLEKELAQLISLLPKF